MLHNGLTGATSIPTNGIVPQTGLPGDPCLSLNTNFGFPIF